MGVRARPRVDRPRHARGLATACSSTGSSSSRSRGTASRRSTRRRRSRSPRSPRPERRTWRWPSRRPATRRTSWRALPGSERAKYLYRIARAAPGTGARVRGAGVDERRQADQGVARRRHPARGRALLLLRRLGRQAGVRVPRPARPVRSAWPGQIIPWNFPMLMAAWKLAPALATGQHARAEARRDHAAHRAAARGGDPGGRAAAGRGQHRDRRRRDGRGAGGHRPSTRSRSPARPRSASGSSARSRAAASGSPSSWAARPRTSCSRTRRSIRPSRAS